jgi:hypothetical protein
MCQAESRSQLKPFQKESVDALYEGGKSCADKLPKVMSVSQSGEVHLMGA